MANTVRHEGRKNREEMGDMLPATMAGQHVHPAQKIPPEFAD
jgi:hypothetical protein